MALGTTIVAAMFARKPTRVSKVMLYQQELGSEDEGLYDSEDEFGALSGEGVELLGLTTSTTKSYTESV